MSRISLINFYRQSFNDNISTLLKEWEKGFTLLIDRSNHLKSLFPLLANSQADFSTNGDMKQLRALKDLVLKVQQEHNQQQTNASSSSKQAKKLAAERKLLLKKLLKYREASQFYKNLAPNLKPGDRAKTVVNGLFTSTQLTNVLSDSFIVITLDDVQAGGCC